MEGSQLSRDRYFLVPSLTNRGLLLHSLTRRNSPQLPTRSDVQKCHTHELNVAGHHREYLVTSHRKHDIFFDGASCDLSVASNMHFMPLLVVVSLQIGRSVGVTIDAPKWKRRGQVDRDGPSVKNVVWSVSVVFCLLPGHGNNVCDTGSVIGRQRAAAGWSDESCILSDGRQRHVSAISHIVAGTSNQEHHGHRC